MKENKGDATISDHSDARGPTHFRKTQHHCLIQLGGVVLLRCGVFRRHGVIQEGFRVWGVDRVFLVSPVIAIEEVRTRMFEIREIRCKAC